jgi:hypothetical protein
MSPDSIHTHIDARFRAAFGQPHASVGNDKHWQLQGAFSGLPINLLLNGTSEVPVLWIFDTDDGHDGVYCTRITSANQIDAVIMLIHDRMKRQATPTKPGLEGRCFESG